MKITVVGSGYVGVVSAACLAELGNHVTCIDIDKEKVEKLSRGETTFFEPGLKELLRKNVSEGRLGASSEYYSVKDSDVVFVCVGTPSGDNGSIDLSFVKSAAGQIGEQLKESDKYIVVVVRSTVVPGTTRMLIDIIEETLGKKAGAGFGLCMVPEHLAEGSAVKDFFSPDKLIIGQYDEKSGDVLEKLLTPLRHQEIKIKNLLDPLVAGQIKEDLHTITADVMRRCSLEEAEAEKYISNAFLASKISFSNELANILENAGINYFNVRDMACLDKRIGSRFTQAGTGFGGSCFSKDVRALMKFAENGYDAFLLNAVLDRNKKQPYRLVELAKKLLGTLENKNIAVLGAAFKPNTDDLRDAPSLKIIEKLLDEGAEISVYDPKASDNLKKIFNDKISYSPTKEACIEKADICLIVTEWDEFSDEAFRDKIRCPVLDGRGFLNNAKGIGKPEV